MANGGTPALAACPMMIPLVLLAWLALAFVVGSILGRSLKHATAPVIDDAARDLTMEIAGPQLAPRRHRDAA